MIAVRSFRIAVSAENSALVIPDIKGSTREKLVWLKNSGSQNYLRISFPEDEDGDYIELAPNEETPKIGGLRGGSKLVICGIGGATTLQMVVWE